MPRVWLDALTPKQLLFMEPVRRELNKRGFEVLFTTREYSELDHLIRRLKIDCIPVGRHGGPSLEGKLEASLNRAVMLLSIVREFRPEVVVATASVEAARLAFGLGVPLLLFSDSPHSTRVARLTVPLARVLYSPWVVKLDDWVSAGVLPNRYKTYKSLDPLAWLSRRDIWPPREDWEKLSNHVVVRLGETMAYYYDGRHQELVLRAIDILAESIESTIVVLSRYHGGLEGIRGRAVSVRVMGPGFFGPYVLEGARLFVGGGGTMTQEAALMGVPTISLYPSVLRVEEELVKRGLVVKVRDEKSFREAINVLTREEEVNNTRTKAMRFVSEMEDVVLFVVKEVARVLQHGV